MDTTLSQDRQPSQQPMRHPTGQQPTVGPPPPPPPSEPDGFDAFAARYGKAAIVVAGGMVLLAVSIVFFSSVANAPTVRLVDQDNALTTTTRPINTEAFQVQPTLPGAPLDLLSDFERAAPTLNPNAIWVSGEAGNPDNDGLTADTPYQSLQRALDEVEPGETVYVMDGKYNEVWQEGNAHYGLVRSGTPDAWITVEAAPGHQPLIAPNDGSGLHIEADYVRVTGLTIRAEGYDPDDDPWGSGIRINFSHHVVIENNIVSNHPLAGISSRESSNMHILNNEVFENAYWNHSQGSGISLWYGDTDGRGPDADGYHDRIEGNLIYRNEVRVLSRWNNFESITDGNGIIIDEGTETNYDGKTLVANNVIFDNGAKGVLVFKAGNVDVIHNTLFNNGRTEDMKHNYELAAHKAFNVRFVNNLVWPRSDRGGVHISDVENVQTEGNIVVEEGEIGDLSKYDTLLRGNPLLGNPSIDENVADFSPQLRGLADIETNGSYDVELADYLGRPRDRARNIAGAYVGPADN